MCKRKETVQLPPYRGLVLEQIKENQERFQSLNPSPVFFSLRKDNSHFMPHKAHNYFIVFALECILKWGSKSPSPRSGDVRRHTRSSVLFSPLTFGPNYSL